jgi:hypothetical protein
LNNGAYFVSAIVHLSVACHISGLTATQPNVGETT